MTTEEEEERKTLEDLEWWRSVARAVDCTLMGFTYRNSASIYYPHPAYPEVIEIPGWFGERILDLKKQAERE